jgi:hypothetical protein
MALVENGAGPYAPPSAVISIIERFRNHGLSTPFTQEVLIRAGVTEALAPRTLQALKLLDLVDEVSGEPTEEFSSLQRASSEDFRDRLQAVLRAAYRPILSFVDPSTPTQEQVRDAFRGFNPVGQQQRMVTLFVGLCSYAGIPVPEAPRERSAPLRVVSDTPRIRRASPRGGARRTHDELPPGGHDLSRVDNRGVLFGVTDADIASLTEEEFKEVWGALGKVARARSRPKPPASAPGKTDEGGGPDEEVTP